MNRRAVCAALLVVPLLALGACTSTSTPRPAASTGSVSPSASASSSPSATSSATASSSPSASGSSTAVSHPKLTGFRAVDVTFVGDDVWALGGADCLSGTGRCDAIEVSHDGGVRWHSLAAPVAAIQESGSSCSAPCVDHLRFATSQVGYAWGEGSSFFTTTDGGSTWTRQPSVSVLALESLDGNVVRVVAPASCPPGCALRVQTAAVGSTSWRTRTVPGLPFADGAQLGRVGSDVYLLVTQNPAGGAQDARSSLFVSADDGAGWVDRGEGCPQGRHGEVDSYTLAVAPTGSVSLLCAPRSGGSPFTATSTDQGAHFRAGSKDALGGATITAFAAASATTLFVSSDDTYRSTDGGRAFDRLDADAGSSPGPTDYLGFASPTLGHALSDGGRDLATTTDAGATWTLHRI